MLVNCWVSITLLFGCTMPICSILPCGSSVRVSTFPIMQLRYHESQGRASWPGYRMMNDASEYRLSRCNSNQKELTKHDNDSNARTKLQLYKVQHAIKNSQIKHGVLEIIVQAIAPHPLGSLIYAKFSSVPRLGHPLAPASPASTRSASILASSPVISMMSLSKRSSSL